AGFFAIGQKPTGSKDPFALRRAALGVLRLLLENQVRLSLRKALGAALDGYPNALTPDASALVEELFSFFGDRLEVHLRDQGTRHDLVRAVLASGRDDDLVRVVRRVESLAEFLTGDDGANLLAGYRRASNIVRIEEKKDDTRYDGDPDPARLVEPEERALHDRLAESANAMEAALSSEDYGAAMSILASLRTPIDHFFDRVTVNADDVALRTNRLRLLNRIRSALDPVANFGLLEG
ncbi:MAG: glycine--tRNA ligase subunit beta, partial [Planctomycetes bacterium]|nr:glycine--tRNA ligase subunit beta [Planctomycetota bacterium]